MDSPPAAWVTSHAHLMPASGRALDLACGRGRHALWLAARGLAVTALDSDASAIDSLRRAAGNAGLHVNAVVQDLETGDVELGDGLYDVIVVVHYLHRPIFPALLEAMRPGGVLIYETFTLEQASIGRPKNPAFLLESGELTRLVSGLDVVDGREGLFDGRYVASVVARKPD